MKSPNPNEMPLGDLIQLAGGGNLGEDPPMEAVESFLQTLARFLQDANPLRREAGREEAVRILRVAGFRSPARIVNAGLSPAGKSEEVEDTGQGRAMTLEDPDPWPEPVDGAGLLDDLTRTFARYIALPEGAATGLSLWTLHAHAHDTAVVSPLLALTSPEKRCGKTTTLSVLTALVPRPLPASNISPAAIFRVVEAFRPTLLVDEADTFLEKNDELRGILNSGHTRSAAVVVRTSGDDHEPRLFSTWAPKAIAKIKDLPGTLADRSVIVQLRRRMEGEKVEKLRLDRVHDEMEPLRRRSARWVADHVDALRSADPDVPGGLHDRAADNWRPLLAIADVAGGRWPERARRAAVLLSGASEETDDVGPMLLADLEDLFARRGVEQIPSADIVSELESMEDRPWPEWRRGSPITQTGLARLLKPFGVKPRKVRLGDKTARAYTLDDLGDAFSRYLPKDRGNEPEQPEQSSKHAKNSTSARWNAGKGVPVARSGENPHHDCIVPPVPGGTPQEEDVVVPDDLFAGKAA